ncbi:GGDEF domain-containing protein [Paenibacillus sp. PAMC 26794]|uniref:diguanylate cyclase domain-containing protein n=1 Tax=Paenibacillus sp. PAMC 26794 TaxID=1257080 RepID=UPI0002E9C84F|nr:GGDEF domain-containing protein [Paenibacillus sp. PAMC 26794]
MIKNRFISTIAWTPLPGFLNIQRELSGPSGVATVSVGGAVLVPDESSNASDLIEKASRALAQAKSEGENRAIVV